jgi:hypothetical protein
MFSVQPTLKILNFAYANFLSTFVAEDSQSIVMDIVQVFDQELDAFEIESVNSSRQVVQNEQQLR